MPVTTTATLPTIYCRYETEEWAVMSFVTDRLLGRPAKEPAVKRMAYYFRISTLLD